MSSSIFEKDGWVGSYNDEPNENEIQFNDNKSALCEFFPFDPGYDRLKMLDSDGLSNYLLKIVYPFNTKDIVLVCYKTIRQDLLIVVPMYFMKTMKLFKRYSTLLNMMYTVV